MDSVFEPAVGRPPPWSPSWRSKETGQDYGRPYHPGAAKYYREAGVLK